MARTAGLQRTARIVASLRGVLWLMGTRIVHQCRAPAMSLPSMRRHPAALE